MFSPSQIIYDHYLSLTKPINGTDKMKFKSYLPEQNLLNYAHRKDGPMPWQHLSTHWNIIRGTKNDVDKGAVSMHTKWWAPEKDMEQWFTKEVARMEGFYEARDQDLWANSPLEGSTRHRMKRWFGQ